MKQTSFADLEYAGKKKQTRRDKFLAEMNGVVPWQRLIDALEPKYFPNIKASSPGRRPVGLERMLRIYFLQQWYGLADEAIEDAIYDSQALRRFVSIDISREPVPDATTLLRFRHWLEREELTETIFAEINAMLTERGLLMRKGTIVDATIIAAPPSTKNKDKARDPEMHQTKKGNQWHFGMKAHIGVDADSGIVHTVVGTAANESDVKHGPSLLHGAETSVHGDAGYVGMDKAESVAEREIDWYVAERRSKLKKMHEGKIKDLMQRFETLKASVRSKVEHPFHIIKNLFKHRKVRYRGLRKNTAQLFTLFGLANLVLAKRFERNHSRSVSGVTT